MIRQVSICIAVLEEMAKRFGHMERIDCSRLFQSGKYEFPINMRDLLTAIPCG